MKSFLFAGLVIFGFSCKESPKKDVIDKPSKPAIDSAFIIESVKLSDILIKGEKDTSVVVSIKESSVFFPQSTNQESDFLENLNPEGYEGVSERANDKAMEALELLEKLNVKNYWSDKRFVSFKEGKREYLIDTRKRNLIEDYCILFLNGTEPKILLLDSLNEETIIRYFK